MHIHASTAPVCFSGRLHFVAHGSSAFHRERSGCLHRNDIAHDIIIPGRAAVHEPIDRPVIPSLPLQLSLF